MKLKRLKSARPRIEVVDAQSEAGFYVRVKSANGQTLAISECYTREEDAERGARALRRTVLLAAITRSR